LLSIKHYLFRMAVASLIGVLVWGLTYSVRRRRNSSRAGVYREGAILLFLMFLAGLLFLTLTPPTGWSYNGPFQGTVNLIPFREGIRLFRFYYKNEMWTALWVNFLGNIIMFIPVGFFAGLLLDRPLWWKGTLCAFGLSLFIELAQLFVCRGTDVDDLILNTLGGLIGHWLFLLLCRISPGFVGRCAIPRKGSV
jgi:glycopeptide antibiotics resistance protein